jgi:purine nucleosidase
MLTCEPGRLVHGSAQAVAGRLTSFEKNRRPKFGSRARALHDPAVIGYLLRPALYRGREVNVAIETQSPLITGMTVVDWWGVTDRKPRVVHE